MGRSVLDDKMVPLHLRQRGILIGHLNKVISQHLMQRRSSFLIIKFFATIPPLIREKLKKKPKLSSKDPRDEVDSMVCFHTRPKVNCAIVTNWFSILVWSDLVWSGLER